MGESRKCSAGNIDIFRDKGDADNPMDREEVKEPCKLENLKSFNKMLGDLASGPMEGMTIIRVPVMEEKALPEECFDIIVKALVEENPAKTQCIFSSQLGKGRTTFGMVVACTVKAIQMSTKLNKMVETGIVLADKMIDICGVPPEGTGIQNLRKCIIQTKYKYDAATEDRQIVWKKMIINFIERYFYLICFATYAKQFGP